MLTREQVLSLQGREFDAAVAEHVMGYTIHHGVPLKDGKPNITCWRRGASEETVRRCLEKYGRGPADLPCYSEPDADYAVLQHVRETWDDKRCWAFGQRLHLMWSTRERRDVGVYAILYQLGDYSRAALLTLAEG